MATIGTFKKSGNEFQGEIFTLSVQAKGVRIVPETARTGENAPSHRIFVGRADYAEREIMRSRWLVAAVFCLFWRFALRIIPWNCCWPRITHLKAAAVLAYGLP